MSSWGSQAFTFDASGTMTITKFGPTNNVTRTLSNQITPSL